MSATVQGNKINKKKKSAQLLDRMKKNEGMKNTENNKHTFTYIQNALNHIFSMIKKQQTSSKDRYFGMELVDTTTQSHMC